MRPMRQRYGEAAQPMMTAIAYASRIVPFIVGFHMPVHPQLNYWAEFSTGGALFAENNYNPAIKGAGVTYQSTEPGDAGLFYPIAEFAKAHIAGMEDGRYTPWQAAGALRNMAANAVKYLGMAEMAGIPDTNEARGAVLDIEMLSLLAIYHQFKIAASVYLSLYEEKGESGHLAASLAYMRRARDRWADFTERGQKYHKRLVFYVGNHSVCRDGNWKDFYQELDADVARLEVMLGGGCAETEEIPIPRTGIEPLGWHDDVPSRCAMGKPLRISLRTNATDVLRGGVNLRYRHTNQLEGLFINAPMELINGAWRGEIPALYITAEWDLLVYFEAVGPDGEGMIYPGLWHGEHMLPYHIVEVK